MENANEAIYTAVYVTIFVLALSLTIYLFSSLMSYSDEAYEYMHTINNNGVVMNTSVSRNLLLTSQEVVTYYFNYIQKDRYLNGDYDDDCTVTINLNTKNETPSYLTQDDLTYEEVVEKLGTSDKYVLTVDKSSTVSHTNITITKATQEEIDEEW